MRKSLLLAVVLLVAAPAFAKYIVVLKDGTRYEAKAKWTIVDGKAIVLLQNNQSLRLDPAFIDVAASEQLTKIGTASANVIDLNPTATASQARQNGPSLGEQVRLRRNQPQPQQTTPPAATTAPAPASGAGAMSPEVIEKFERAFENVGIFGAKVIANGAHGLRVQMTVDTEDKVFNAISATSFLMVRNAGVDGARIDMVELFMGTTTGGAAGRFQMSRADAEALDKRTISQRDYFVRKVIY
ncbi:MAG TPA: hypothetical protein VF266_22685 [Thermoanaerobaculia bacterium]